MTWFEQRRPRRVFDIVTGDEACFHHYESENKHQSKDDSLPKEVRESKSSGKRVVAIFFIKSDLIESDALESGGSINARPYVTNCLSRVFDTVTQTREKIGFHGLNLHDDNSQPYRAWMTTEYLAGNRVELYQNPPYLPDLSLCDFFLFQKLKNQLREIQFNNDEEVLKALDHAAGCLGKEDSRNCFDDWFSRMQKCIDADEEHFKKTLILASKYLL